MIDLTPEEQIAKHYAACLDSVALINSIMDLKPKDMDIGEASDVVARNVVHLELMLAKDFWKKEDLKPLKDAVTRAKFEKINIGTKT